MQYSEQDERGIKREVLLKSIVFFVILALIAALLIVLLNKRMQFWTSALTIVLGGLYVFSLYVFWVPPMRYLKYRKEIARGQRRMSEVTFEGFGPDAVLRDGLWFYPVTAHDDEGFERVYYWDAQIPRAQIAQNARVRIHSYGQNITSLETL